MICKGIAKPATDRTGDTMAKPQSIHDDELVLAHSVSDHALSEKIGHSVRAIQIRRSRLKKREDKS